ncbi:MAG: LON peptidase substrate-binding domain-containing protein [Acidimicrobiia bacterium]
MPPVLETLPMFPLGLVALPGSVIPLRLFEPRYLALHEHLVIEDDRFGIVLIERGTAEAGGGDDRFAVGTVMSAVRSSVLDDGTVLVFAVGQHRIRIHEWLDPQPYPIAIVERLGQPVVDASTEPSVQECARLLRRLVEVATSLGSDIPEPDLTIGDDAVAAMYEIAHIAPLQEIDQQRILEQERASAAAEILRTELLGILEILEHESGET